MPKYHRLRVGGGTFFFTVNLADRSERLLTENIVLLRRAFADARRAMPFSIDAIVVLPDHLHCIWILPEGDGDFSSRWHLIKSRFSQSLPRLENVGASRARRNERGIWQRRFWEHAIRDDRDYAAHLDHIHYNPVKHGHAPCAAEWRFSSFHRYVRAGVYPAGWAGWDDPQIRGFGEAV